MRPGQTVAVLLAVSIMTGVFVTSSASHRVADARDGAGWRDLNLPTRQKRLAALPVKLTQQRGTKPSGVAERFARHVSEWRITGRDVNCGGNTGCGKVRNESQGKSVSIESFELAIRTRSSRAG